MATGAQPLLSKARLRGFLWILLMLAGTEFVIRGPVRFLRIPNEWNDLSQSYTASRLWLQGQSPANPKNFVAAWKQESGSRLDLDDVRTHLAPPLGGLVVMAPIAAFHFHTAKVLWLIVLLVSFAATVWALARMAGLVWSEPRALAFIAGCLALAPFQTGIANANATVLVIGLCAVAMWAATCRHDATSGLLFGIACSLKPQIGAFLVLYYLVRLRWRLFFIAASTTIGLFFAAALYLYLRGASWLPDYVHNARGFVTANNIDDFSSANPARFTLINLQVPFFSFTASSSWSNWLAFAVTGALLCAWVYWVVRDRAHGSELLALGAVSAIALLPVYHRFYDAALLAVPLCWCVTNAVAQLRSTVRVALLLTIPFLFPGAAFLQLLGERGSISSAVTHSWWWNCMVMPHETWALLLLALILLSGIAQPRSDATQLESTSGSVL